MSHVHEINSYVTCCCCTVCATLGCNCHTAGGMNVWQWGDQWLQYIVSVKLHIRDGRTEGQTSVRPSLRWSLTLTALERHENVVVGCGCASRCSDTRTLMKRARIVSKASSPFPRKQLDSPVNPVLEFIPSHQLVSSPWRVRITPARQRPYGYHCPSMRAQWELSCVSISLWRLLR